VSGYTPSQLTAILVQVVIVAFIARRSYAMTRGVPYSATRLVAPALLVLALWALVEITSTQLTPWSIPYLIGVDLAVLVATAVGISGVAARATRVDRAPTGQWSYRIGFALAAVFVGAFALRLLLAAILFPGSLGFTAPVGGYPSVGQQEALAVIDALFSLSVGLLVGRSVGIYRRVRSARSEPDFALAR